MGESLAHGLVQYSRHFSRKRQKLCMLWTGGKCGLSTSVEMQLIQIYGKDKAKLNVSFLQNQ